MRNIPFFAREGARVWQRLPPRAGGPMPPSRSAGTGAARLRPPSRRRRRRAAAGRRAADRRAHAAANADGSRSEVSGNGVRCIARGSRIARASRTGATLHRNRSRCRRCYGARARRPDYLPGGDGAAGGLREEDFDVGGEPCGPSSCASATRNAWCLARPRPSACTGCGRPGGPSVFPEGTNVELAEVERPDSCGS